MYHRDIHNTDASQPDEVYSEEDFDMESPNNSPAPKAHSRISCTIASAEPASAEPEREAET